ncbi:MAG: hypothetical protein KGL55_05275, partial [Rhodospirillales bacterium]|nr:hypothetical protein [Rhodospirillales bacterium]
MSATVAALVDLAGAKIWAARQQDLRAEIARSPRVGRALAQRHAIELVLEKLRQGAAPSPGEARVVALAETLVQAAADLPAAGRARLRAALRA